MSAPSTASATATATAIIRRVTGGSCDIQRLRGPACAPARKAIANALGIRETGINAIRTALIAAHGIVGTCAADEDAKLSEAIKREGE